MSDTHQDNSPAQPTSLFATRRDAASMLSVSLTEIDNLRRAGKLLAKKNGSKVLIPITELERFAKSLPWDTNRHM